MAFLHIRARVIIRVTCISWKQAWTPEARLTPAEALLHPFFHLSKDVCTGTDDISHTTTTGSTAISDMQTDEAAVSTAPLDMAAFIATFGDWTHFPPIYQQQLQSLASGLLAGQIGWDRALVDSLPTDHQRRLREFRSRVQANGIRAIISDAGPSSYGGSSSATGSPGNLIATLVTEVDGSMVHSADASFQCDMTSTHVT